MTTPDTIVERVRRAVLAGDDLTRAVSVEVRRANETALRAANPYDVRDADIVERMTGLGPLQPLLDDPSIEEVWVNGPDEVFIARAGRHERVEIGLQREEMRTLVERMLRESGRRIDVSQPFVDASLADGSRLHVVIPPITRAEWSINIRKFPTTVRTLDELVGRGTMPTEAADIIANTVRAGSTILVSGATQAGKTTMLCAALDVLDRDERVVTVEETFEIATRLPDVVGMQCRVPSLEGVGEVTLRRLVKEALRMRPTRLVVGEVRGDEALDLLVALNSGIPGLCTIHANSGADAIRKLLTLCQLAGGVSAEFVATTVESSIDVVVHCRMEPDGQRRVTEIATPRSVEPSGRARMESLWSLSN